MDPGVDGVGGQEDPDGDGGRGFVADRGCDGQELHAAAPGDPHVGGACAAQGTSDVRAFQQVVSLLLGHGMGGGDERA